MRTFAHKPESTRNTKSTTPAKPGRTFSGQSPAARSILHPQRTIGNQAVQQSLDAETNDFEDNLASDETIGLDYNFSRIPVHASVQRSIQPKLKVGAPGDKYEREADHVAAQVTQQGLPVGRNYVETGDHSKPRTLTSQIPLGSNFGKPLDTSTNEEMSRKIGFDFSNVRVHTDDPAIYLNTGLNSRACTYGSDIFFNKDEYNPNSSDGKKLLAHELTHVVQQSGMTDGGAQRKMIQCTTIGEILDEFFSPFSKETLWVMDENDNYTKIVRKWQPVIEAVNKAKANLESDCATWSTKHMTDSSWKPGKTDPPVTDPNAHGIWVSSPPGTDPKTCRNAFILYITTKANPITPTVQSFALYTCSIGSFGIYATVDSIDCAAKTAKMKIWMYNAMDRGSFGKYASHPAFKLSGMERQYMWWNWSESHSWGAPPPGGSSGGGSGKGSGKW